MPEAPKKYEALSGRHGWSPQELKLIRAAGHEFEENGYEGAAVRKIVQRAGATQGAFYYHFDGKKDLAAAILKATFTVEGLVEQDIQLQMVVDTGMILAYKIVRDTAIRAALRLSLTYNARDVYGTPWPDWININTAQLDKAKEMGEVGADVDTVAQAHQISGAWSGIVLTHHAVYGNLDGLEGHVSTMYQNLMTVIAHPRILRKIDFSESRGRDLYQAFLERQA
ncbi:TetR family transcriptional regulator [Streptomyces sp. NPDC048566]|uniref:TetR family transcriptional regulator n=1 Tax=Streptomyces sp. NPDC048566 TaxID=3365569 RepID=UPI0037249AD3